DADEQECRDEREFVKRVEEEQIQRRERTRRAGVDEQDAREEHSLAFCNPRRNMNRRHSHERREEQHDEAEPIRTEVQAEPPTGCDAPCALELRAAPHAVVTQYRE